MAILTSACGASGDGQSAFGVTEPPASGNRLSFTSQPAAAVAAGTPFAVQVAVQNANGATISTATNSITLSLTSGTGTSGAVLGGTRTANATGGVAAFNNLTIDRAGSGFTLTATANGVASGTSAPINVNP
jgi:hypothetical protein